MILYYLLFLAISCDLKVSSEFRAGNGGGDGHVQAVGSGSSFREVRDEQSAVHLLGKGWRDAFSLVSHHDESPVFQLLLIDVVAIEQGAIYGYIFRL